MAPWCHGKVQYGTAATLLGLFSGCIQEKGHWHRKPEVQGWYLCYHLDWEISGGAVERRMVQQKGEFQGLPGCTHFCPLKPVPWLQRAKPSLYTKGG
eukprot:9420654-Ditylum_brightwellii.AAC.1